MKHITKIVFFPLASDRNENRGVICRIFFQKTEDLKTLEKKAKLWIQGIFFCMGFMEKTEPVEDHEFPRFYCTHVHFRPKMFEKEEIGPHMDINHANWPAKILGSFKDIVTSTLPENIEVVDYEKLLQPKKEKDSEHTKQTAATQAG